MKLLITGKSCLSFSNIVEEEFIKFKNLYPNTEKFTLISFGGQKGVDADVRAISRKFDIEYVEYKANFNKYGFDAKKIRNTEALKECKPNIIWIFHSNEESLRIVKDIQDLLEKASRRRIPVKFFEV